MSLRRFIFGKQKRTVIFKMQLVLDQGTNSFRTKAELNRRINELNHKLNVYLALTMVMMLKFNQRNTNNGFPHQRFPLVC